MDKSSTIKYEAREICNNHQYSQFITLLGLSSAINLSVYPNIEGYIMPLHQLFCSLVKPIHNTALTRCSIESENIITVMWSRDGDIDNTPGVAFSPNHFVLLVPENMLRTKPSSGRVSSQFEPPRKRKKKNTNN